MFYHPICASFLRRILLLCNKKCLCENNHNMNPLSHELDVVDLVDDVVDMVLRHLPQDNSLA